MQGSPLPHETDAELHADAWRSSRSGVRSGLHPKHLEYQVAFGLVRVAGRVGEAALVRAVDLVGQDVQQHLRAGVHT